MITIIFGAPGSGKSAINTYFLKQEYFNEGKALLKKSSQRIEEQNRMRINPLSLPEKPPLYSDYSVSLKTGYQKSYEPYFLNGYYLGLPDGDMPLQLLPPCSKVHLSEVQRYFDSRQSSTMPDRVSRFFEMHRHYDVDFFLDLQRPGLVDANIRSLCKRFLEVVKLKHEYEYGQISGSTFYCRQFDSWTNCEQYLQSGKRKYYDEVKFVNEGDIFRCYNSFSYFNDFLPADEPDKDFSYLPFLSRTEGKQSENAAYYSFSMPKGYRTKPTESSNKDKVKEVKQ